MTGLRGARGGASSTSPAAARHLARLLLRLQPFVPISAVTVGLPALLISSDSLTGLWTSSDHTDARSALGRQLIHRLIDGRGRGLTPFFLTLPACISPRCLTGALVDGDASSSMMVVVDGVRWMAPSRGMCVSDRWDVNRTWWFEWNEDCTHRHEDQVEPRSACRLLGDPPDRRCLWIASSSAPGDGWIGRGKGEHLVGRLLHPRQQPTTTKRTHDRHH